MKKNYKVTCYVEETLIREVTYNIPATTKTEAESIALDKVEDDYKSSSIILSAEDFENREFGHVRTENADREY
ncbi:DpnD/PcfM family protein [Erysipelothrix aquatica]|uniref:DpnD/PcfM family protein n=1 Tax=Erysipelothrix aquatica TaxID=2683714 RepID=UPI0013571116|nr:DpnD/PcfM family protein [Erysipelothrix aquatica]